MTTVFQVHREPVCETQGNLANGGSRVNGMEMFDFHENAAGLSHLSVGINVT